MVISTKKTYFDQLTGVRAIAAYMVFFHHFNPFDNTSFFYNVVNELHIGVTLFFVLSGFLIAYRYLDNAKFNFRKYIINRFSRIYPMYFILTSFFFLYKYQSNIQVSVYYYLMNITFLKGLFKSLLFTGISQGWSLTVEEMFYLFAPVIFLLIKKSIRWYFILPFLFILFGIILVKIFSNLSFYGFFATYEFMFNYTFFGRCLEFFIGVGLAIIIRKKTFHSFVNLTFIGFLIICITPYLISLLNLMSFVLTHNLELLFQDLKIIIKVLPIKDLTSVSFVVRLSRFDFAER
jgi:peptidoglycan/LPS O-acetylase OafA/YrhL